MPRVTGGCHAGRGDDSAPGNNNRLNAVPCHIMTAISTSPPRGHRGRVDFGGRRGLRGYGSVDIPVHSRDLIDSTKRL